MNISNLLLLFFTFLDQFDFKANEISLRTEKILTKRIEHWLKFLRIDQCNVIIEGNISKKIRK